uniref:thioredoxin-2-like n=1 Tax=Erigeron canadensis TaxID=72917 RepID=UPI001CB90124|nr:thioredoxin-2-like [Erigeron canadensis]
MGSIVSSWMKSLVAPTKRVTQISDWKVYLKKESRKPSRLTVIYFFASWYSRCNPLEPGLDYLASKYTDINFFKIDIDKLTGVAKKFQVNTLPTLVVLKQGEVVKIIDSDKIDVIENMIKEVAETEASKPAATN